ncbi:MAG: SDR family oxidoreductase [Planctomycetota bacterium]
MSEQHANRIAVISGATAGIGLAIARDLAAGGAKVVVNGRRVERLNAIVDELGADAAIAVPGDAGEEATVHAMLDAAPQRWGREADLVVVNAGRGLKGSVFDSDTEAWASMVRLNVVGAAHLMREAGKRMLGAGPDPTKGDQAWLDAAPRDIVVLGSNVGKHISPFSSMYGGTKFAVNSLAEALRRELGPRGVRVTLIAPGVVKSEFQSGAGYDPEAFGAFMDEIGPVLTPEDVARTVGFVVSQPPAVHLNDVLIRPTRQSYP